MKVSLTMGISSPAEAKRCLKTLVLELAGIIMIGIGMIMTFMLLDREPEYLTYFTIQSNFLMWITLMVFFGLNIYRFITGIDLRKNWMYELKFIFSLAVLLTFAVFVTLLVDYTDPNIVAKRYTQMTDWSLHLLGPLLAVADFFYSDYKFKTGWKEIGLTVIFPLYYFVFAMSLSAGGFRWPESEDIEGNPGAKREVAPYGFLDYEKNGWFWEKGRMGVFFYIVIIAIIFVLVAWGFTALKDVRATYVAQHGGEAVIKAKPQTKTKRKTKTKTKTKTNKPVKKTKAKKK